MKDLAWFTPDGKEMSEEDWSAGFAKSLGVFLNGTAILRTGEHGERLRDDGFYMVFNAHHEPMPFTLPPQQFGTSWSRVLDTAAGAPPELKRSDAQPIAAGESVQVQARSVVVLRSAATEDPAKQP